MDIDAPHSRFCRWLKPIADTFNHRHCVVVLKGFKAVCRVCQSGLLECLERRPNTILGHSYYLESSGYDTQGDILNSTDETPRHLRLDRDGVYLLPDYAFVCEECPSKPMVLGIQSCLDHRATIHGTTPTKHAAAWIESRELVFGSVEVQREYVQRLTITNRDIKPCFVTVSQVFYTALSHSSSSSTCSSPMPHAPPLPLLSFSSSSFVVCHENKEHEIPANGAIHIPVIFRATYEGRYRKALVVSFRNSDVQEIVAWLTADAYNDLKTVPQLKSGDGDISTSSLPTIELGPCTQGIAQSIDHDLIDLVSRQEGGEIDLQVEQDLIDLRDD
ncbi:hypothetical protein BGW41_004011 [Actinomortierella wolfii]|nr:hypothetical protein BGW41_004011 [Actinomortierella wolfii]